MQLLGGDSDQTPKASQPRGSELKWEAVPPAPPSWAGPCGKLWGRGEHSRAFWPGGTPDEANEASHSGIKGTQRSRGARLLLTLEFPVSST